MRSRELPPPRTSSSQGTSGRAKDLGSHHRANSSDFVHAWYTRRAGPLKVRVTTSSRSDFRSTAVGLLIGLESLSFLASIDLLLLFEFFDQGVQRFEARFPALPVG